MASGEESGFLIEGERYEVPGVDTLDFDEAQILYERTGLVQEDFVPLEGETEEETTERRVRLTRHPQFVRALAEIAYKRGNPKEDPARVKAIAGKINRLQAITDLVGGEEEADAGPPDLGSTSEPTASSPRSSDDSSASSGSASTPTSDEPDDLPEPTGATRSATSSRESCPRTLGPSIHAISSEQPSSSTPSTDPTIEADGNVA